VICCEDNTSLLHGHFLSNLMFRKEGGRWKVEGDLEEWGFYRELAALQ